MKKFLLLSALALSVSATKLSAQLAGWSYYQNFQVTENSGNNLYNYQLRLDVNTATPIGNNQMLSSGADIRFGKDCQGSVLYNYWIESGLNTANTIIWVKIDTLLANSTENLFMYYGNNSASSVSAVNGTFIGPHSSTDSVSSGGAGGATNSQRGFRFAPTEDILVTSFGKREPNGSTRYVTLFNFSTQAIITQTQVSGPAAQYSYGALPSPLWLTSGTQYVLELYQGATDGYYFGTSSQIGQHITYYDMRYCNSCTQNTFPNLALSNYHYGYPDLWYYTKRSVSPAPTYTIASSSQLAATASNNTSICFGDTTTISVTATGGTAPYTYSWNPSATLSAANAASTSAFPTATTTYTVSVNDISGCAPVLSTVTVNVNALPVIVTSTAQDSICLNDSTTITASGASTYMWSPNNAATASITVSPAANTTYMVMGTDSNGCMSSASIDIAVLSLPVVSATTSLAQICDNGGDSVSLTASGATTYDWDNGASQNNPYVVTPTTTTTYMVVGTDIYGCMGSDTLQVIVVPHPDLQTTNSTICQGDCDTISVLASGGTAPYTYLWADNSTASSTVVCPPVSTCYMINVTDANGCTSIDSVCITVNPTPILLATGPQAICIGNSATLMASGCGNYNWQPGNASGSTIVVSPTSNITYTVTCSDSISGCPASTTIDLIVNPLPVVTINGLNSAFVTDAPYTLPTYASPAGGSFSGPGVTGNQFDPGTAGVGFHIITYTYTDLNGCTNTDTMGVLINIDGISENTLPGLKAIYPNPFNTSLVIEISNGSVVDYQLTDALGRLVLTGRTNGTRTEIATETFPAGIYWIRLTNDSGSATQKIIKQ
jgi:hypothetical protein